MSSELKNIVKNVTAYKVKVDKPTQKSYSKSRRHLYSKIGSVYLKFKEKK